MRRLLIISVFFVSCSNPKAEEITLHQSGPFVRLERAQFDSCVDVKQNWVFSGDTIYVYK